MREGGFARLRALILLVAFGFGLAAQAFAFAPMAMAQDQDQSVAVSMVDMSGCPDCAGGNSSGHLPLTPANCALALCSISATPAILPQAPAIALRSSDSGFIPAAATDGRGIAIRPDLGPPRTIHLA